MVLNQCRCVVGGKHWNYVEKPIYEKTAEGHVICGRCDPPDKPNKTITINSRLRGEELLDTIIHEVLHAASWDVLDEGFVEQTATDLARILWKLGYRKIDTTG